MPPQNYAGHKVTYKIKFRVFLIPRSHMHVVSKLQHFYYLVTSDTNFGLRMDTGTDIGQTDGQTNQVKRYVPIAKTKTWFYYQTFHIKLHHSLAIVLLNSYFYLPRVQLVSSILSNLAFFWGEVGHKVKKKCTVDFLNNRVIVPTVQKHEL